MKSDFFFQTPVKFPGLPAYTASILQSSSIATLKTHPGHWLVFFAFAGSTIATCKKKKIQNETGPCKCKLGVNIYALCWSLLHHPCKLVDKWFSLIPWTSVNPLCMNCWDVQGIFVTSLCRHFMARSVVLTFLWYMVMNFPLLCTLPNLLLAELESNILTELESVDDGWYRFRLIEADNTTSGSCCRS